jgi:selenide,water dikinase
MPRDTDDRVLVDWRTADDAGVFRWEGGAALVQTVDFFTPIVDDPYVYGQIAAANALSDVYAMGGRPLTALAIAAFPARGLDPGTIERVFRGGYDKLREAGVALLGGHTVQDAEIKFGYAVTGQVDPARMFTNAGARPGDVLVLTKPIGTGVIGTAIKGDRAPEAVVQAAVASMTALNRAAAEVLRATAAGAVHACTDVTGFGLMGHLAELAAASGVGARVSAARVPLLPGALDMAAEVANRPGGMGTNEQYFGRRLEILGDVEPARLHLLFDPQTSGGLLVAVDPAHAAALGAALEAAGVLAARIGHVGARGDPRIVVD